MREFLLVVPDLMLAGDASCAVTGARLASLRFGPAEALAGGWRAWLASRLGHSALADRAVGTVVASLLSDRPSGGAATQGGAWLATPLHLVAGLETLHLPRDGILWLEPAERAEFAAAFAAALGAGQLALLPVSGDTFVLRGLDLPEVATLEPACCLGADLARVQPAGAGAQPLRRLMSEIEMWLHDHPLNRRRVARGLRPVRALWLWGGHGRQRPADTTPVAPAGGGAQVGSDGRLATLAAEPRIGRAYSDDAWVRAACGLAAVEVAPEGAAPGLPDGGCAAVLVTARFHAAGAADPEAFDRRHLAAAAAALAAGRLDRLTVLAADRLVSVRARDRFRWWRPRRPWLTALGA